jgi:hypothetical protein
MLKEALRGTGTTFIPKDSQVCLNKLDNKFEVILSDSKVNSVGHNRVNKKKTMLHLCGYIITNTNLKTLKPTTLTCRPGGNNRP